MTNDERQKLRYFKAANLEGFPGLVHAFLTKEGGDDLGLVAREFHISPSDIFLPHQVHGNRVAVLRDRIPGRVTADSAITSLKGVALGVFTADCLPIILFDPRRSCIGIVHAGWRGSLIKVAERAVKAMAENFACDPADILAALGPTIGPCCYQVGEEVYERFRSSFIYHGDFMGASGGGRYVLDLIRANTLILREAGLSEDRIYSLDLCTRCRMDLFHSHRGAPRSKGRQLSLVLLDAKKC